MSKSFFVNAINKMLNAVKVFVGIPILLYMKRNNINSRVAKQSNLIVNISFVINAAPRLPKTHFSISPTR